MRFMNGRIFVDTNVLVYSRDASKLDKQTQAPATFRATISPQILVRGPDFIEGAGP